jgi:hypothetical protein
MFLRRNWRSQLQYTKEEHKGEDGEWPPLAEDRSVDIYYISIENINR